MQFEVCVEDGAHNDSGASRLPEGFPHFREVSSFPGPWLRRVLADPIGHFTASLRFGAKKDLGFDRARNETRGKKWKRGERFLPHPLPALLLAPFFRAVFDLLCPYSCSSFFAPKPHRNACYAGSFYVFVLCSIVDFPGKFGTLHNIDSLPPSNFQVETSQQKKIKFRLVQIATTWIKANTVLKANKPFHEPRVDYRHPCSGVQL